MADETAEIKQTGGPTPATVTTFELGARSFMVVLTGFEGVPTYFVWEVRTGVGDNGDGESGPMPYEFVEGYDELEWGIGGHADPKETLRMALENEAMTKLEEEDDHALRH